MTDAQKKSVLALLTHRIGEQEFFLAYGVAPQAMPGEVLRLLEAAEQDRDEEELTFAMMLVARFGEPGSEPELVTRFNRLLPQPWHKSHEEMLHHLQRQASPSSIDSLRKAIALKPALPYLDYDDYGAFYKKCLWALQAIGTEEAFAVIRESSTADDPALRAEAEHRLERVGRK